MKLEDYAYDLPEELIAVQPPVVRGSSRLLVLDRASGALTDSLYRRLPDFLEPGDLLIMNNTKVIKARLLVHNDSGAQRELLLLEKHGAQQDGHRMKVMYRRRLKPGAVLHLDNHQIKVETVNDDGTAIVTAETDLLELAERYGAVPLPPYLHRESTAADVERYQTVFAKENGSVAAPTASLNLTDDILQAIRDRGVRTAELTLHVGLGTFMPIRTEDVTEHTMHQEYFHIPANTVAAIRQTKAKGKRVVAVGTTVTRTLEYAASDLAQAEADISGEADIFIYPGYTFKVVDAMVTNFHAPHSTVLMMAAAFAGWDYLKTAYEHAALHGYQFLSYGDSMFIH